MYADSQTVAEARDQYFRANGFSLASYTDRWVKLKLGPLPLAFPNTAARKAAVKLHDLHHVATGYATTWTGESEIAAYEIAAGCGRYWAAWGLNVGAFGVGLLIAPRRTFRAFVRGRHARSLYRRAFGEDLLALTVGDLRRQLGLAEPPPPANAGDVASFAGWAVLQLAAFAALPVAVVVSILLLG